MSPSPLGDTRGLRVVFAGTPEFAVPCLEALADSGHTLVAVYTQPDRPAGRGRKLAASPIKECALSHRLPVYQPERLRDQATHRTLADLTPDVLVVVAYGLILPQAVLDIPRLGCINVHASLLPRWRGAAPIQRAISAGDTLSGVTIMQMDAGLDTGPVLLKRTCPIRAEDTAADLHDRLAQLGAVSLVEALDAVTAGTAKPQPQPDAGVTYAHKLSKTEADIDWQRSAIELDRQIHAFNPWPVAQTTLDGETLRIWLSRPASEGTSSGADVAPGTFIRADQHGVIVATGEGCLELLNLQRSGGRPLPASEFIRGLPLAGRRLG